MKNMALEETTREFVESGQYAKLPTEAEKAEAEKELKEAKEAELGIEDPAEDTGEEDKAEEVDRDDGKEGNQADGSEEQALSSKVKEAAVHEAVRKSRAALDERKLTRAEAETTPEALKVKRAKARAAYNENRGDIEPSQLYDVKVK